MGVRKEAKDEIVKLMLQDIPTDEIAKRMNYSVGTIRKVFEELREEYGVNSKPGIAAAYLRDELVGLQEHVEEVLNILDNGQIATGSKSIRRMPKKRNRGKK